MCVNKTDSTHINNIKISNTNETCIVNLDTVVCIEGKQLKNFDHPPTTPKKPYEKLVFTFKRRRVIKHIKAPWKGYGSERFILGWKSHDSELLVNLEDDSRVRYMPTENNPAFRLKSQKE